VKTASKVFYRPKREGDIMSDAETRIRLRRKTAYRREEKSAKETALCYRNAASVKSSVMRIFPRKPRAHKKAIRAWSAF